MRVAILLKRFPTTSETFVATQILGLLRRDHDVAVFSQLRPSADEPIHVETLRLALLDRTFYVGRSLPADSLAAVSAIPFVPGGHDVLHAHFGPNARQFLFARDQAKAPLVVSFHGYDFSSQPAEHGTSMYERLFEVADAVTFNCDPARRALEMLGCPGEKLRPVATGVDVDSFDFRERHLHDGEPVRILTVGRLVEKKGHGIALRALAAARDSLPTFRYDIVGGGPLASRLASLVDDFGLSDAVRLHGARDSTYVRRLLGEAHIFLLASRTAADKDKEGAPVALMEAQACGLPVVSTLHSGIPEVVLDGRTGLLVAEGDHHALAEAVVQVVREPESWAALGAAGRAHVEATFDATRCTEQLLDVYRFAVSRYNGRPETDDSARAR